MHGHVARLAEKPVPAARDVDDVLQEALLKVIAAQPESPVRSPKAYRSVVACNLAIMLLRRQQVWRGDFREEMDALSIREEGAALLNGRFLPRVGSMSGHIVVRVEPGGDRFRVFVTGNRDENDTIVATFGPYESQ